MGDVQEVAEVEAEGLSVEMGMSAGVAANDASGAVQWLEVHGQEKPYYHNPATGESTWERPRNFTQVGGAPVLPPPRPTHEPLAANASFLKKAASWVRGRGMSSAMGAASEWAEYSNESGTYYYNSRTGHWNTMWGVVPKRWAL